MQNTLYVISSTVTLSYSTRQSSLRSPCRDAENFTARYAALYEPSVLSTRRLVALLHGKRPFPDPFPSSNLVATHFVVASIGMPRFELGPYEPES